MGIAQMAAGDVPRMQFPTEFDWVAPSGRALLTCFMADHYSAGWWMDSSPTLEEAELEVHRLFTELAPLAATRNVLLPMGTDYSPPNRWLTADPARLDARYVWPKFLTAIPREFFDAVREELADAGARSHPQTRDMNPVYTGKDVSFIDTKQAQRPAENTLLTAEKFATLASLLGARFPTRGDRQGLAPAAVRRPPRRHHRLRIGPGLPRPPGRLARGAGARRRRAWTERWATSPPRIDTSGEGRPVTVFNPLSWPRTDVARVVVESDRRCHRASSSATSQGPQCPSSRKPWSPARWCAGTGQGSRSSRATCLPSATGRTGRCRAARPLDGCRLASHRWRCIENERYPAGGRPRPRRHDREPVDKRTGKELIRPGRRRQRAPRLPRVPEPPALRRRARGT